MDTATPKLPRRADLLEQAATMGIAVPRRANRAQIAALIERGPEPPPLPLAENTEARDRILELASSDTGLTKRQLAERAGYRRRDLRQLLADDPDYADAFREARGYGAQQLEDRLRVLLFRDEPPTRLFALALEAWHPDFKRTRRVEMANADNQPFQVSALDFAKLSPEERDLLKGLLARVAGRDPED